MQETEKPRHPKKRRQRRKDARPAEIIDAAMGLWAKQGFAATKLDDVAKAAGIAKGTIYLYFDSKEALFESAVEERMVSTILQIDEFGNSFEGTTEDLLKITFSRILEQMLDGGSHVFFKVLIAEGHRFPEIVKRYRTSGMEKGMMVIKRILMRGVERGELRPGADMTDPRLIMAPLAMSTLWEVVFNPAGPPINKNLVNEVTSLLLDGLHIREK